MKCIAEKSVIPVRGRTGSPGYNGNSERTATMRQLRALQQVAELKISFGQGIADKNPFGSVT